LALLAQDPRPGYTDDPERIFGMAFGGYEIRFKVEQKTLKVLEIEQK
ncbi:MAG: tRNA (N6-threonylcarbamoyladenosine(37)-N6)-methyltransferase TrmO, partial [Clostridia bacterium]|nr:tRNA (N6-threonylcarbamoyladenosine(37)-N6)-methyltransferase TrmO [Clostridia bacterium]